MLISARGARGGAGTGEGTSPRLGSHSRGKVSILRFELVIELVSILRFELVIELVIERVIERVSPPAEGPSKDGP